MSYYNIFNLIGDTPVMELKRYSSGKKNRIFAKLEGTNPGGSIKDRIALYMIRRAQKNKLLPPGKKIIEATSGNTGIGLAMLSAVLGYRFVAVMPDSVSIERRKLLKAYGAQIILTDGKKGTDGAILYAKNLVKDNGDYLMLDQFANPANVLAHYQTTAKEIICQIPQVTHFVAGMGTGGTLMGVGKRLKEYNPLVKIIGIEPKPHSKIQGLRNMTNFTPPIFNHDKLDGKLTISNDEPAFELARDLFRKEGLSVGISSGAALWGAIQISRRIRQGIIVTIFPDRGDKYLSTPLFSE
ncbi:cysteine synthase family protein [Candidatus Gottesmanbacteria bacterium]|nr:cysteine synthase family protein [Candidatus Gottesmanbacteria bacterium]